MPDEAPPDHQEMVEVPAQIQEKPTEVAETPPPPQQTPPSPPQQSSHRKGAPPLLVPLSNYTCAECGRGPFEGPRSLARHETKMHARRPGITPVQPRRTIQNYGYTNADEEPPMETNPETPKYVDPDSPEGLSFAPPTEPIELSPVSELARKLDQTLSNFGYNSPDWVRKRRVLKQIVSSMPGYGYPQPLGQLLYQMGIRDNAPLIIALVFGQEGTPVPIPNVGFQPPIPGPGMPYQQQPYFQQPPNPYAYYPNQQPPSQPNGHSQPQPQVDRLQLVVDTVETLRKLGVQIGQQQVAQQQFRPPDPSEHVRAVADTVKAVQGLLPQPQGPIQQDPFTDLAKEFILQKLRGEDQPRIQQPVETFDQTVERHRRLQEIGMVQAPQSPEIIKLQNERLIREKEMAIQDRRVQVEEKRLDQERVDAKENAQQVGNLLRTAIENVARPLSQAVGEGLKSQMRGGGAAPPGQIPQDAPSRLAMLQAARQRIDQAEAEERARLQEPPPQTEVQQPVATGKLGS